MKIDHQLQNNKKMFFQDGNAKAKAVTLKSGRLYFTKAFERKLFFFMTLSMLVMGILVELGLF